jgi:hypothetical protein
MKSFPIGYSIGVRLVLKSDHRTQGLGGAILDVFQRNKEIQLEQEKGREKEIEMK